MAEAPRKITIKLRPPAGAKPAAAPAPAPAPVAEAPAAPEAPVMEELTPIVETPTPAPAAAEAPAPAPVAEAPAAAPATPIKPKVTIKLKPVSAAAPAAEAPAAPAVDPLPEVTPAEMAQQAKRQTSRIELPPEITQKPMSDSSEAETIKLKPISEVATEASENPQAAKSKTARIELDSVLGGIQANTPLSNNTQKTIKLKRATPTVSKPSVSAPMGGATPAAPAPAAPAAGGDAPTIKLKRPAAPLGLKKDTPAPAPAAEPELESLDTLESLDDMDMAPLTGVDMPAVESTGMKAFTIVAMCIAVASIIVTLMVCYVLQQHAASPDGSAPTGNTLHSLQMERL